MKTLDELARDKGVFQAVDKTRFQRKARILQALWREKGQYDTGTHRGQSLGSLLPMPWAEQTKANFLDDDIRRVVQEVLADFEGEKDRRVIKRDRLYGNLLSSQPLAFNLFAHLRLNRELATHCLQAISNGRIHNVTKIDFEYSSGRGDSRYTGDNSAFDVCVRFDTPDGHPGLVGIEVKYHENLQDKPSRHHPEYDREARLMGCFCSDASEKLVKNPLQQIWRDHLLVGAHLRQEGFADGFFAFLSPKDNTACNDAVAAYRSCLSCSKTFEHWTIESLVAAIKQASPDQWIRDFEDRYLDFSKVDRLLV